MSDTSGLEPRTPAGPAGITSVAADAPLTGDGTSGSHLGISPATSGARGTMSAADKTKLDNSVLGLGWIFGDGEDGDVTLGAGTTTLTADMFYRNLTIPSGATLNTGNFKVYVSQTLQLDSGGSINRNGNSASGSTAGGSLSNTGTLSGAGTGGINGLNTNGGAALGATNSPWQPSASSGSGGNGSGGTGGAGATHTLLASRGRMRDFLTIINGSVSMTSGNAALPGGISGGSGAGNGTQPGGGAGGGGGPMAIYAYNAVLNGTITSAGGNGGNAPNTDTGGGGGGTGGYVIFVYHTVGGLGLGQITAPGGSGGTGNGAGTAGTAGGAGVVRAMQL